MPTIPSIDQRLARSPSHSKRRNREAAKPPWHLGLCQDARTRRKTTQPKKPFYRHHHSPIKLSLELAPGTSTTPEENPQVDVEGVSVLHGISWTHLCFIPKFQLALLSPLSISGFLYSWFYCEHGPHRSLGSSLTHHRPPQVPKHWRQRGHGTRYYTTWYRQHRSRDGRSRSTLVNPKAASQHRIAS